MSGVRSRRSVVDRGDNLPGSAIRFGILKLEPYDARRPRTVVRADVSKRLVDRSSGAPVVSDGPVKSSVPDRILHVCTHSYSPEMRGQGGWLPSARTRAHHGHRGVGSQRGPRYGQRVPPRSARFVLRNGGAPSRPASGNSIGRRPRSSSRRRRAGVVIDFRRFQHSRQVACLGGDGKLECATSAPNTPALTTMRSRRVTGQAVHCGAVRYEVSAEPVDAKICHCRTCQSLHGAPMQWAAIFHKHHVRMTRGIEHLRFYSDTLDRAERVAPCK
jgi:Glutathione-dependent formaldehyde-activating enzyme